MALAVVAWAGIAAFGTLPADVEHRNISFTESTTWTVPEGVQEIGFQLWGGGGGGCTCESGCVRYDYRGGGGGAWAEVVSVAVTAGAQCKIEVGRHGVNEGLESGSPGGSSWIDCGEGIYRTDGGGGCKGGWGGAVPTNPSFDDRAAGHETPRERQHRRRGSRKHLPELWGRGRGRGLPPAGGTGFIFGRPRRAGHGHGRHAPGPGRQLPVRGQPVRGRGQDSRVADHDVRTRMRPDPPPALYRCEQSRCVSADTGVPEEECHKVCGPGSSNAPPLATV